MHLDNKIAQTVTLACACLPVLNGCVLDDNSSTEQIYHNLRVTALEDGGFLLNLYSIQTFQRPEAIAAFRMKTPGTFVMYTSNPEGVFASQYVWMSPLQATNRSGEINTILAGAPSNGAVIVALEKQARYQYETTHRGGGGKGD